MMQLLLTTNMKTKQADTKTRCLPSKSCARSSSTIPASLTSCTGESRTPPPFCSADCHFCRAPHIVHTPLQVPESYYNKFSAMEPTDTLKHDRQTYVAMVSFADDAIRNFTEALKAKQMYERTLLIFTAE